MNKREIPPLTEEEKRLICDETRFLVRALTKVFDTPDVPDRNRYVSMLRAIADFMRKLEFPRPWREKLFKLGLALAELDDLVCSQ